MFNVFFYLRVFSPMQIGETSILSRPFCLRTWFSRGGLEKCNAFRLGRRHQPGIQIRLAYPRGVWARQWFYCPKKGNPFVPVRGWQSHILMTPGNVQTVVGYFMICLVILAWCYSNSTLRESEKRHKSRAVTDAGDKRGKTIETCAQREQKGSN